MMTLMGFSTPPAPSKNDQQHINKRLDHETVPDGQNHDTYSQVLNQMDKGNELVKEEPINSFE